MRDRQRHVKRAEMGGHRGEVRLRVLDREEWEVPAQTDRWFNVGLMIISIAAGAAIAALSVERPVARAVLWTLAACLGVAGVGCLLLDREINRGRRSKRSRVVEETMDEA
jgi:hypothetical protein